MDQDLNHAQFKHLLENIANTLQGSGSDREDLDPEILSTVLKNTHFFQKYLEAPANLHDFVHLAKDHLSYEVFPYGSVLIKEGDYADRLCLILRGTAQKLQQRPYEELEREIRRKNPKAFKEDQVNYPLKTKESTMLRNNPRYLQHTVATKKKTHFTKNSPFVLRVSTEMYRSSKIAKFRSQGVNKISSEASNGGAVDSGKVVKTMNNLERADYLSGGENANDRSLNEQEWDDQITQQTLGDEEDLPVPTKSMVFARLRTLHRSNTKKTLTKLDIDTASLEDLGMDEDSSEGKKKDKNEEKMLNEDDLIMLRYVSMENPEIKQRLYIANIPRVEKGRCYKVGDCFGDNFYKENRPKETSLMVVNSEELHVLSLSRESYQEIMAKIILNAKEKADFFIEVFPSFDSETVVKFSYHFSEKQFKKNETIYHQDHLAQELYLLKNGDVRLTKGIDNVLEGHPININTKRGDKTILPVASIIRQQFFGEELLLKEGRRLYTAMAVSSGSTAYFISLKEYNKIKNGFVDLLKVLKQQTRERFGWRQQRVVDLLEKKKRDLSSKKSPPMHLVGFEKVAVPTNGEEILHKSPRGLDLTRVLRNNSDGAEDNNGTINSGRGEYLMLTKVKSAKNAELGSKNLELYKAKYSRKTKLVEKALLEEGHIKRQENNTFLVSTVPQGDSGAISYNIRRELATVKSHKVKLPLIKSPKTTAIVKDIGYVKSIGSIFKEPSIANLDKKRQGARSTVLDYLRFDTMEDDTINEGNQGKGKMTTQLAHLPLRMYGLVKRVEEKDSIFAQKNDEFGENSQLINYHKIKFPKKVAGGFNMAPRKTSGEMLTRLDGGEHDLTLIAGRKTELLNKI